MTNIIDFKGAKERDEAEDRELQRAEMLAALRLTIDRVNSGEITGVVICATTDTDVTYDTAGGYAASTGMVGLMFTVITKLSNIINMSAVVHEL